MSKVKTTEVKLPAAVAEKYNLVDYGPGSHKQVWGKYGEIDITKLTLEKADRLFKNKWPKLALKEPPKAASDKGKSP